MDRSQRELRRAAAQAFMESLDQLGRGLADLPDNPEKALPSPGKPVSMTRDHERELEAAVADIEQFIQSL